MNLKETVNKYIETNGDEGTAEKLGVKVSAVRVWKATGRVPLPIVQQILDQIDKAAPAASEETDKETDKETESTVSPEVSPVEKKAQGPTVADVINNLNSRLKSVEDQMQLLDTKMIQKLVAFAKKYTDPDRHVMQQGTVVPLTQAQGPLLDVPKQVPPERQVGVPQIMGTQEEEVEGEGAGDVNWNEPYKKYRR